MSERFPILFRPEALEDLRRLGAGDARRVIEAIGERLIRSPEMYGKPLGGKMAGLRRVRVGDLRIVYKFATERVEILIIQHRKIVYDELAKRWGSA